MLPERPVEPVPRSAAGESEPFSPKNPALSPRGEMASAAREACGAGAPAGHGESEPFSQEFPALSPGVEMPSATRVACGAGTHASHGGKCTVFAGKTRHFPRGSRTRGEKTQRWDEMLNEMKR